MKSLKRTIFLGLLVAAVGSAQAISVNIPAGRLPNVLTALSAATGEQYSVKGSIRNEIISLNIVDASAEEIRAQLASVTKSEWMQDGDVWVLQRTPATDRKMEQEETAQVLDSIRRRLQSGLDDLKANPEFNAVRANQVAGALKTETEKLQSGNGRGVGLMNLMGQTPGGRALTQLLSGINLSAYASAYGQPRFVYALNPTRMQFGLPNTAMAVAQKLVAEQQVFNDALQASGGNNGIIGMMMGGPSSNKGSGPIAGIYIVVTKFMGGFGMASMSVVNSEGQVMATANATLGQVPFMDEEEQNRPKLGNESELKFPKELLEFDAGLNPAAMMGGGGRVTVRINVNGAVRGSDDPTSAGKNLPKDWREKLLQPDKYEPLGLICSGPMESLAKGTGKNLIVVYSDMMAAATLNAVQEKKPTLESYVEALRSQADSNWSQENGWIKIMPNAPVKQRLNQYNRSAMADLFAVVEKNADLTIDQKATYAAASPEEVPNFGALDTILAMSLFGDTGADVMGNFGAFMRDGYRAYGSLNGAQRKVLMSGGSVPMASLTPDQKEVVHKLVYWSFDGPFLLDPRQRTQTREIRMGFGMGVDVKSERTVLLPNGLIADGTLTMAGRNEPAIQALTKQGKVVTMSVGELAFNNVLTSGQGPQIPGAGLEGTQYDGYRMASQSQFTFKVIPFQFYELARTMTQNNSDNSVKFGSYASLPQNVRQQVAETEKQIAEGMKNGIGSAFGSGGAIAKP